jgi:hypothetical protein
LLWISESATNLGEPTHRQQAEHEAVLQGSVNWPGSDAEEEGDPQEVEIAVHSE